MKYRYKITGLDCPNCAAKLAAIIEGCDGIENAKINFLTEKLTIESDMPESDLLKLVNDKAKKFDKAVNVEA